MEKNKKMVLEKHKDLNKFLQSIHMGTKTFRVYKDKAQDEQLIDLIDDTLDSFKKHEISVTQLISSYGLDPTDELSIGNEFIVMMEKMKMPKSDFDISIYAIKGINMGITNGLEFIHEHQHMEEEAKEQLKEVVEDYSWLLDKYNDHIQKNYI